MPMGNDTPRVYPSKYGVVEKHSEMKSLACLNTTPS
jgi:hypothetical protein